MPDMRRVLKVTKEDLAREYQEIPACDVKLYMLNATTYGSIHQPDTVIFEDPVAKTHTTLKDTLRS